jgi:hypothetical protein
MTGTSGLPKAVEVVAEGVELADHLARQMRLGGGAGAAPARAYRCRWRASVLRQAFKHRYRVCDRLDRHPARRLAHGRPTLVDGRSNAMPLDQAILAARDREAPRRIACTSQSRMPVR